MSSVFACEIFTSDDQQKPLVMYGFVATLFGTSLIACLGNKICHLSFCDEDQTSAALAQLQKEWPDSILTQETEQINELALRIFAPNSSTHNQFEFELKGTPFQIKVWNALCEIPFGTTLSYQALAHTIGQPTATRAVAHAVARNAISYLIPCHRVIYKSGRVHKYRWGGDRKKMMLKYEGISL